VVVLSVYLGGCEPLLTTGDESSVINPRLRII